MPAKWPYSSLKKSKNNFITSPSLQCLPEQMEREPVHVVNSLFQKGVVEGKSATTPLDSSDSNRALLDL